MTGTEKVRTVGSVIFNYPFIAGIMWHLTVISLLNAELNPICHLLALLGAHPILHISRIRVKADDMNICISYQ